MSSRRARDLGQNFLVDRNVLDVVERHAALTESNVVLEIGGGLGVLSERLCARAGHVHVVEIDRRLEPKLREKLSPFSNVTLHMIDVLSLDFITLDPPPTKVVANLPYAVAATILLRTIEELPSVTEWVVMVQREVGERLAAAPGSGIYGATSVLAQLACDVKVLRRISRNVFRPVPNVDSVLLAMRRRGGAVDPRVSGLVHDAFAHRRKALASSLALAAQSGNDARTRGASSDVRSQARTALVELGHPADERAERLEPDEFRKLAWLLDRCG